MADIKKITGKVSDIQTSQVQTKNGIKDVFYVTLEDGLKLSGWGECPYEMGKVVNITYEIKGQYNNIVSERRNAFVEYDEKLIALTERVTKLEEKVFQKKS